MIDELLPALSGRFGDRADAVRVADDAMSWESLAVAADAVAAEIGGMPAIAVPATASIATVIGVVAGLRAGVPVVPVPHDAGPAERGHIVRDSGAVAIVGSEPWPELDLPVVRGWLDGEVGVGAAGAAGAVGRPEPAPDAPALIMYTSGTTGAPKGAVLSRRAIAAGLDGLAGAWEWTPADLLVHGLPLFHVHGLILGVLGPLRVGSAVHHTGRPTPAAYAGAAADGGSLFFGVPTVWSRIAAEPDAARALRAARLLVSGSAALPVPVFDALDHLCGQAPIERYGMTETLITLSTRASGERRPGWVGLPIEGVRTRVVADDGRMAERDSETIGELQVSGATLFEGYLGRPEATAASFDGEWFRTGDAAVVDPGGMHRIIGRMSMDIIKTGGFKVGAGEVEAVLLRHPAVREVAVVGVADADLGQRIVAYVVGEAGDGVRAEELIRLVADELSVHKRPREVRLVEALPRNAMGKVQKQLLT